MAGRSHQRVGLPCQDSAAFRVAANQTLVIAVADGAGSASEAERGSSLVTQSSLDYLEAAIDSGRIDFEKLLREAAAHARSRLEEVANCDETPLRSFASTLLLVVSTTAGGAALQIGDGLISVAPPDDEWCWVFWPQRGEYANTTHFLTDDAWETRLQAEAFKTPIDRVAVLTDGLEPLALHYESRTVFQPFLNGIVLPLATTEPETLEPALHNLLSSERVMSRTDDDLSLVAAILLPADENDD